MEPWVHFMSSTLYLLVYMELSFRLSFYLRHSLGGYMVDTTEGFPVKIMEALAHNLNTKYRGSVRSTI
jgi:hypothetical protein